MQTSMIQVDEYFKCHLQRSSWQQLPPETRQAAVKMAEEDIMLALGCEELDIGDLLIFCAVCEQALFLALNEALKQKQAQTSNAVHGELKSESIEGIGKREYFERKTASADAAASSLSGQLSPRSELFLSRLPAFGIPRFSRG